MNGRRIHLAWLMVLGLAGVVSAQEAAAPLNLTYVPDGAAVIIAAHPRAVMTSKAMELLPREIFSAATLDEVGIDIMQLEQVVVFGMPPVNGPPAYGVIARFSKDVPLPRIPDATEKQVNGKPGLVLPGPMSPVITHADGKTLIAAPEPFIPKMLQSQGPTGLIAKIAKAAGRPDAIVAVADIASVRPLLKQGLSQAPELPPQLQPLLKLPDQIDVIAVQASLAGSGQGNLMMRCTDAAAAAAARDAIAGGLAFGKMMGKAMIAQEMAREEEPMRSATLAYVDRVADVLEKQLTPTQQGTDLRLSLDQNIGSVGVLVALLLPAVQAAREAARRMQASNNLKQIGLAMHNYHDTHKSFPPRYTSKDGKPLLSWRVHLLPYLEQQQLYQQFNLDEPWDSEHNIKLVKSIPQVYVSPNQTNPREGKTVFLTADGDGTLLDDEKGVSLRDVRDGSSNTIMAVEADVASSVFWTKPDDLPYNAANPFMGVGHLRPGGFQAVFADGSVHFLANAIDKQVLQALFTRDGGEAVNLP